MDKRTTRVGNCHQFLEMSSEFELREYRIEILNFGDCNLRHQLLHRIVSRKRDGITRLSTRSRDRDDEELLLEAGDEVGVKMMKKTFFLKIYECKE